MERRMDTVPNLKIENAPMQNESVGKRVQWAEASRQRRQDPLVRAKERMKNLIAARLRRQNPEIREREREKNRMAMRIRRQNPEFREKERRAVTMRRLNLGFPIGLKVQTQKPSVVEYERNLYHFAIKMPEQTLINTQEESEENTGFCINEMKGALPLELEMRVEEEEVDDPDEVESNPDSDYDESQEELQPIPVEVTITPCIEEFHVKQEEDDTSSLDATTLHEEVDIKEEEGDKDEEEIERPLEVNIKEEQRDEEEEEEEVVIEPSFPDYETSCDGEKDPPEVKTITDFNTVLVEGGEDHNSEEEILPHAAMVVVPGRADEYPEDFVEENVAVRPSSRTVKRQKFTSKRVNTVYRCKDCAVCYTSEEYLRRHMRRSCWSRIAISGVDTVYRCPNCSLCYTSPEYLAGHVRRGCRYRPTPIKNAYLCIICGEGFNNYGDLYQHKRQKHDQAPAGEPVSAAARKFSLSESPRTFKCPNCPRAFTAPGYLVQHQRSHLRQQTDHSCDLCGEDFREKPRSAIEEHFAKSHPTTPPHRCDHCHRIYGQRQNLVAHLQAHGEFGCFVCNKRFTSRQILSAHFRTHANNQPFVCNLCSKSYLQQGRFYEHRRREHGIVERPTTDPREPMVRELGYEEEENVDDDVQVLGVLDMSTKSRSVEQSDR